MGAGGGAGLTYQFGAVLRLVPVFVHPSQPGLESPIAELGAPANAVVQFSHLGHQESNLARKNQVLAGASGCWGEKQSRQGHWGLFPVPASQTELGKMYLLNLGLKH